jgi:hypothetical protein
VSQPNESESSRWWEFYAVRYAMGTVVGAIVFFFLCLANPVLKPLLFGTDTGTLDGTRLTLLAGYGLAYCYIASAPILVFHIGRYLLEVRKTTRTSWWRMLNILAVPLASTAFFYFVVVPGNPKREFFTAVCALTTLLLWPQYLVIGVTLFKSKELYVFYQKLANKRSKATGGITDSYKHMREHGNSFAIVLLEVMLALILYAVGSLWSPAVLVAGGKDAFVLPYLAVVLLWVVPAALVWMVGTLFEREFSGA